MSVVARTQAIRFLRLFAAAILTQAVALQGTHIGRSAIVAAVVGAAEVAYRQFRPVVPVAVLPGPVAKQAGIVNGSLLVTVLVIIALVLAILWLVGLHVHVG